MKTSRSNPFVALAVLSVSLVSSTLALDYQWDVNSSTTGLGGSGTWDTTNAFWDGLASGANDGTETTTAPTFTSSDTAIFGGTAGTVDLGTGVTVNGLSIGTANYVITGNTLTLAGTTPTIAAHANASISSALAGSAGLVKTGAGNLTITGANTYTGGTTVNAGTLTLSRGAGFGGNSGSISTGALTVDSGAIATTTTAFAISGDTSASNTRVVNVSGTLNLAASEYIRTYNLTGGTINAPTASGDFLRASAAGLFINSLASATTSTINNKIDLTFASATIDTANGAAASDLTIAGVISENSGAGSGAKPITKSGAGTLTLTGANTFTGNTTITGGTLAIGGAGRLVSGTYAGAVAISSGANLEHGSSTAQALTGVISGAGSLIKNGGAGVLTLSGLSNNTYSGGTTIGNGTVSLGTGGTAANTSTVAALGTGTVNINSNGILRLWIKNDASFTITNNLALNGGRVENEDGTYTLSGTVSLAGANTFETTYSGKNLTFSNTISGAGSLTVIGGGNTTLSGANTYTGATTVDGTRLILANATATSGIALSNNGELRLRNISLSSTQNITGAGNVTKDVSTYGASTINGNNNTYTGSTTVNIDRFTVGSTGVINGTSGIAVQAQWGANFNNLGSVTTAGAITVAGSGNTTGGGLSTDSSFFRNSGTVNAGSITLNSSSSANTTANRGGTYSQTAGSTTLSGTATLAANGGTGAAGTAGNDAAFNLTGGTFSAGTLAVNSGTVTATGGSLNLGSGGITKTGTSATAINLGSTTLGATAAWSSSVDMTLTDATTGTTFDTSGGNISLSGALSGVGSKLVKSGTGSLTLSGTSTYSGTTTVSAGTLLVNGTLGNTAVTVSNGATLGGTGIITGSVAFSGDSMLNIADVSDGLDVTGAVTFGSGFGFDNISGWDYQNAALGTYTLLSGGNISLAGMDHVGLENAFTLNNGNIAYFQQGSLQAVIAVPETGSALLGGIGLLLLLRRRR